jgi:hypothetical protein
MQIYHRVDLQLQSADLARPPLGMDEHHSNTLLAAEDVYSLRPMKYYMLCPLN